jgi:hypothetical protein
MTKTALTLFFWVAFISFGQADTLRVDSNKAGNSYLTNVLLNKTTGIGVFEIHYTKGRLSNAYYCAIDLNQKEIRSTFNFKNWTYLNSAWVDTDNVLHLSKGIFGRMVLIDLTNGTKRTSDKQKRKEKAPKDAVNDQHLDSQDLYCTGGMVYYNKLRIQYDSNLQSFILDPEN